jgi:hypothetical protein
MFGLPQAGLILKSSSSKLKWNTCPSTATFTFATTLLVRPKPLSFRERGLERGLRNIPFPLGMVAECL